MNQVDYGMRVYDPRIGKFLSVDPLGAEYPWNSPYAYAENDVIRSIDLDGLEKYIISTQVGEDLQGKKFAGRNLIINPDDPEGKNGLIKHIDANGKETILNDPNRLSEFDRQLYDVSMQNMAEGRWSGGEWKILNPGVDIGLKNEDAPFNEEKEKTYRRGISTVVEEKSIYINPSRTLDISFNYSNSKNGPDGAAFSDNGSIKAIEDYANFLLKNGINRIDLGISTNYQYAEKTDPQYGNAQKLLDARAATVAKAFGKFGITINSIKQRFGEAPSVWGTASTKIKVVTGWNISQIPVQQQLLNGKPTGPIKTLGQGSSPKFQPNTGQPAPKSGTKWN